MNTILKRILEYIIIIIICAIISSVVFAYEFNEYDMYFEQQMILNNQLVQALEILAEKISSIEDMRGI